MRLNCNCLHTKPLNTSKFFLFALVLLMCSFAALGQSTLSTGNPAQLTTIQNAPQRDTNLNKSNTNKWYTGDARVWYEKLGTARIFYPDTSIHTFHRRPYVQPWKRDLGNLGSPVYDLMFTPEYRVGPTLGYHVYDVYRFNVDSLGYYNTNRPYSVFGYNLGSRLEQVASLFHTQNIRPNWNVAVEYRKTNSPGAYLIQRNNHDNASFTTNYKSLDKHYAIYAAMVYNKEQHDENGGIENDADLSDEKHGDRKTIPVVYLSQYSPSKLRSSITNVQRDFTALVQQSYTWGRTDTTYNADSTQYAYRLVPRFSITHKVEISTEKHTYNDLTPDSMRYDRYFAQSFLGGGYYAPGADSVYSAQKWFWVDNKIMLNGYLGKIDRQLKFSAGIGNRYDRFRTEPIQVLLQDSLPKRVYVLGRDQASYINNYLTGEIKKEALNDGQWEYIANGQFFFTGEYAGDLNLNASLGKSLKKLGMFTAGVGEQVQSAPYNYTFYGNAYATLLYSFGKESVTRLYATLESPQLKLSAGVRNYLVGNYIFLDQLQMPRQTGTPFNITQGWIRKMFRAGRFYLDNEIVAQQVQSGAPVNVPLFMGRHQLSFESPLFHSAIKVATGAEVRYNAPYKPAGYSAQLNRFYYQDERSIYNTPELSIFVNFRIKRFRAYIMGDQLQKMFVKTNTITFVGAPEYIGGVRILPVYAMPDAMLRFGFTWALIN